MLHEMVGPSVLGWGDKMLVCMIRRTAPGLKPCLCRQDLTMRLPVPSPWYTHEYLSGLAACELLNTCTCMCINWLLYHSDSCPLFTCLPL